MTELKPITPGNFSAVLQLQVAEEQTGFVASNVYSIAQSKVFPSYIPLAVTTDETPVGFVLYGLDTDDNEYWLARLMVDKAHQGMGYGRQALALVIEAVKALPDRHVLYLSVEPENEHAIRLYQSAGFAFDGRVLEGEHVMKLTW